VAARVAENVWHYRFQRICWMCRITDFGRLPNLLITLKNYFVREFFVVKAQPAGVARLDATFGRLGGAFPGQRE
jgi:hypothetical protein